MRGLSPSPLVVTGSPGGIGRSGGLLAALTVLPLPSEATLSALQAAPTALGKSEEALASPSRAALMLPGMLLIVSLPSQGMVSKASCHISMGLLFPAGRAISWQAQGWSRRGRRPVQALPCSGPGAFVGTGRPLPLTHYYFFPPSLAFKQCFSLAYGESLLPRPCSFQ